MKHQRWLGIHLTAFHFADENDMIALRIATSVVAFEPCRYAPQDWQAGSRQLEVDSVEAVLYALRKTVGKRGLIRRKDIDYIMRVVTEDRQAARIPGETPEYEGRMQRHGIE
jgi:hypothetical protein